MRSRLAMILLFLTIWSCAPDLLKKNGISLKNAASFPVGTVVTYGQLTTGDSVNSLIVSEFNRITPVTEMQMDSLMPKPYEFRWDRLDTVAAFSMKNNLQMFGHALSGHASNPGWLKEEKHDSASLSSFLQEYITTYVERYRDVVTGWNVVSEPIADSSGNFSNNLWYSVLGESYVDQAFVFARKADPRAELFINGFFPETDTLKLNALISLVSQLENRGVPVTGIGLQMHLYTDSPLEMIAIMLNKAADTRLKVYLSEVQILFNRTGRKVSRELTSDMATEQGKMYQHVAEMYRNIIPENQQFGITVLGFSDRNTSLPSPDAPDWPALFDHELRRKPAYFGILNGVRK